MMEVTTGHMKCTHFNLDDSQKRKLKEERAPKMYPFGAGAALH